MNIRTNVSLAPLTSWQVGGDAEFYAEPKTVDEVRDALQFAQKNSLQVSVLGGGSNVLVADRGVSGLVICLRSLAGMTVVSSGDSGGQSNQNEPSMRIEALAGTSKTELLRAFLKLKLPPAVFLAGIPGDVGGGVVMNAGVGEMISPREFVEITEWIDIMRPDGHLDRVAASQLRWRYRHCEGWQPGLIVRVGLCWTGETDVQVPERVRLANQVRHQRQPLHLPSCGSVFVNPANAKAGALIESAGLKGFAIGQAQVSEKHANFIVNTGGATASDIDLVIRHVQTTVKAHTGILLQTEVVYLGPWP
jgi:UDP-N-acetylmuramate dehydrogenase